MCQQNDLPVISQSVDYLSMPLSVYQIRYFTLYSKKEDAAILGCCGEHVHIYQMCNIDNLLVKPSDRLKKVTLQMEPGLCLQSSHRKYCGV